MPASTYNVTQSFKVDLTYRYLNYGSVTDTIDCTGGCNPNSYKFGNLSSQDLMLGVRWRFPVEGAGIVEQPASYTPPPPPPQYPLSTRG